MKVKKNKGGRPPNTPDKYTPAIKRKLLAALKKYTKITEIPILAEFAWKNDVLRNTLYNWPEFLDTIKKLIEKKEAQLEKLALAGAVDKSMAIFSLKQLGWRDTKEITHKNIRKEAEKKYSDSTPEDVIEQINAEIEHSKKSK